MSIPDYQALMLPLLRLAADGREHPLGDAVQELARRCEISEDEKRQVFASGNEVFRSRVGWARQYLKSAGLLAYPKRGYLQITDRGREALRTHPDTLRNRELMQYPEFREYLRRERGSGTGTEAGAAAAPAPAADEAAEPPEEQIESGYRRLRLQVEADLLQRTKAAAPEFFERLVVRLLVAMGYGGSLAEAGEAIGGVGDGGIDGIIREDRLGLGVVAVQAKRWAQGTVGRPEVQAFVGAMQGRGAKKGVFITTAAFTREAEDYARRLAEVKVALVDGLKLAALMFDCGLGVAVESEYAVKRLDSDFFDEAE
jgi:restriction system protein